MTYVVRCCSRAAGCHLIADGLTGRVAHCRSLIDFVFTACRIAGRFQRATFDVRRLRRQADFRYSSRYLRNYDDDSGPTEAQLLVRLWMDSEPNFLDLQFS